MNETLVSVAEGNRQTTIWNREFINILIINIIINLGQYMTNTLIPKYAEGLGATATIVGVVSGMFAITSLCVRPIVGPATSYLKKNILLATTIGIILLAFVVYGFSKSIAMIMVGRLLHGLGIGFLAPVCLALASNVIPDDKMASGIGIFSLAQAAAAAVGPSIGLSLTQFAGYSFTFYIGAGLMGVAFVMALMMKSEEPVRTEKFNISFRNIIAPEVVVPAVMMFFLSGAYSCINSFIVIYGELRGVTQIGMFFTAYSVCVFFSRPFSGKIADKFGLDKVMIPGLLIFLSSFILISFSNSLPMFLAAGAVSAFGYGICQPCTQTLCMKLVPRERRGVAGNTNYIGVDSGYLIMPVIAGTMVTAVKNNWGGAIVGYQVMYRVMTIPILIALAIFIFNKKRLLQNVLD